MWEVVGKALAKIISPAGLDNRPYWHLSCGLSYRYSLPTNAWRMWHRSCNHSRVWCVGVCIWWNAHRALGAWASWKRSFGRHVVSIPRQYWGLQYFSLKFQNPSPTKPPSPPHHSPPGAPSPHKKKKNEKRKKMKKKSRTVFPCGEPISQSAGKVSDNLWHSIGREVRCYGWLHDVCAPHSWLAYKANSLVHHVDGFLTCGARLS